MSPSPCDCLTHLARHEPPELERHTAADSQDVVQVLRSPAVLNVLQSLGLLTAPHSLVQPQEVPGDLHVLHVCDGKVPLTEQLERDGIYTGAKLVSKSWGVSDILMVSKWIMNFSDS